MKNITKEYTNGEVTIVWKPDICAHSGNCFRGLNEVFDPRKRPWVTPDGITSNKIVEQIKKCPSGALSYYMNKDAPVVEKKDNGVMIEATANGPLLVRGDIELKDQHGAVTKKDNVTALCRCGGSHNKPFCDGTHRKINFQS
jgi:uncharacterized Fe-S cluster protein YjdI